METWKTFSGFPSQMKLSSCRNTDHKKSTNEYNIMKKRKGFQELIGKTKNEIISELGNEFNHYPADKWTYYLRSNWMGLKTYLLIYFNENIVDKIEIVKSFGKIKE